MFVNIQILKSIASIHYMFLPKTNQIYVSSKHLHQHAKIDWTTSAICIDNILPATSVLTCCHDKERAHLLYASSHLPKHL